MYHYVRDGAATSFPRLPACSTTEFENQLDHIVGKYSVVPLADVAGEIIRKVRPA